MLAERSGLVKAIEALREGELWSCGNRIIENCPIAEKIARNDYFAYSFEIPSILHPTPCLARNGTSTSFPK